MTSERTDQGAAPSNHHSHPGATLASQREAMGWSVEQVAEQLKLAVRQVVAIESGDYASLPSPAVTRGFVRAYAKILRLDPAPLVAMIPMDSPVPADDGAAARRNGANSRPTSFSHSRYPTHGKRSSLPLGWIAGVVVVAAAGAAAWHFGLVSLPGSLTQGSDNLALSTPADAGTVAAPVADGAHNPAVPLISVPAPAGADAGNGSAAPATAPATASATAPATVPGTAPATAAPATGTPATAPLANGTSAPPIVAPAGTAAAGAPAAVPTTAPGAAAGAHTLVLTVREDSWIEVRPRGGRSLVGRVVPAGSIETVEVPGTATLVVGNPKGVSATLGGASVALPPVPGKTISRVTLNK